MCWLLLVAAAARASVDIGEKDDDKPYGGAENWI